MHHEPHTGLNGSVGSHAAACVAAGLCALPATRRGDEKRVALASWKPFQSRRPSEEEIRSWFASGGASEGGAMCLVCGAVSGNLEMIDFDLGGEAFDAWRTAIEAAAPGLAAKLVVESTPSGGRHVVYRSMSTVSGNLKLAQRRIEADGPEPVVVGAKSYVPRKDASGAWAITVTMIETRGEGGLFLCAPSEGYVVLQGDLRNPPVLTADERDLLLGSAWALNEVPEPVVGRTEPMHGAAGAVRPGDDYNRRGDPRDALRRHGWTLARPGANEHWRRPGKSSGTSATLKDGTFYVFSSNAMPFEAHKGYSPFAVHALLDHGGDFAKAASALASEGYGTPAKDGGGVDISAFTQGDGGDRRIRSVRELRLAYPALRPPVIHGLLREGETMNVIASPKTGKSWLTIDLALAVATGRQWLGRFQTVQGDVLIIDNELHHETSSHRIPKVAEARGIPMREIDDRVGVDNLRGRLRSLLDLGPYFDAIEPGRFKVIVLDAFYRFMPVGGDENDNGTMANIYNVIDAYADRLRCSFILIHHSTKGSQSGKSVTDVGAGAGAQSRATDTHLVLRPHEENGVVVLDAAVRSWAPVEPVCLRWTFPVWNADGMLDPAALKPEGPQRRRREPREPQRCVPEAVAWTPESFVATFIAVPSTRDQVVAAAKAAGLSEREARSLIGLSVQQGLVAAEPFDGRKPPRLIPQFGADELDGHHMDSTDEEDAE
jgi:hypothetical protein